MNFDKNMDVLQKTILPFCPHEGSRLGRRKSDIASIRLDAQDIEIKIRNAEIVFSSLFLLYKLHEKN